MAENILKIIVDADSAGQRLDLFLVKQLPHYSRSLMRSFFDEGRVTMEGKALKPSHLLRGTEIIGFAERALANASVDAEDIPLDILYEDAQLIVLNKPAGIVVHPGAGIYGGTLVNALLHHCKDLSGIGGVLRPGIVHRLDKGTSGVLLVAKTDPAHQSLSQQFHDRQVEKKYQALVWGKPRHHSGLIKSELGRSNKDRKKMSSTSQKGRAAETFYQVLKSWELASLLELRPVTGRTHQLRVHLTDLGHPILGDPLYGKGIRKLASLPSVLTARLQTMLHPLLHAHSIKFHHPISGELMSLSAPLRTEIQEWIKILNDSFPSPLRGEGQGRG